MCEKLLSQMSSFHIVEFFVIFSLLLASTSVMGGCKEKFVNVFDTSYVLSQMSYFPWYHGLFVLKNYFHILASIGLSNGGL